MAPMLIDGAKVAMGGWGLSSEVECLPSQLKPLGSVLSSDKVAMESVAVLLFQG